MCVDVLPACTPAALHGAVSGEGQKRAPDSLDLELQLFVSFQAGLGTKAGSSVSIPSCSCCSTPLRHLCILILFSEDFLLHRGQLQKSLPCYQSQQKNRFPLTSNDFILFLVRNYVWQV